MTFKVDPLSGSLQFNSIISNKYFPLLFGNKSSSDEQNSGKFILDLVDWFKGNFQLTRYSDSEIWVISSCAGVNSWELTSKLATTIKKN